MKKRILIIRPTMGMGGADRVTWQLLHYFDRSRFEISLGVMRGEGPFMKGLPEDVKVVDFSVKSLDRMVLPLYRHLRRHSYDYLYSTSGGTNIVAGLVKSFPGNLPEVILSERNILFPPYKGKTKIAVLKLLKRMTYRNARWVTSVSEGVVQELHTKLGIPLDNLRVVHNPLIDEQLQNKKKEKISHPLFNGSFRTVLAVGRMVQQKDYPTLLSAFQKVKEEEGMENVLLVILGDGPLQPKIDQQINDAGLKDSVYLEGYVSNPYKYMTACDVFVLSSLHEGLPGVLVQALACGAPCVSTDCPTGPSELITHGENGFLVPVGSVTALTERILQLLRDQSLREAFSRKAPSAVERYHTSRAINSYFEFI